MNIYLVFENQRSGGSEVFENSESVLAALRVHLVDEDVRAGVYILNVARSSDAIV